MSRSDELDLLSGTEMFGLLADATVTVSQRRPTGAIDPDTRERTIDASAVNAEVDAIEGEQYSFNDGTRPVTRREWTLRADSIAFRPSREGTLTDAAGRVWAIVRVTEQNNGRDYLLVGEMAG